MKLCFLATPTSRSNEANMEADSSHVEGEDERITLFWSCVRQSWSCPRAKRTQACH